jgi:hypothetical protein
MFGLKTQSQPQATPKPVRATQSSASINSFKPTASAPAYSADQNQQHTKSEEERSADALARNYKKHQHQVLFCQYKLFGELPFAMGTHAYRWIYFGKELWEKVGIECFKLSSAIAYKKKGVQTIFNTNKQGEDISYCYGGNIIAPHEDPSAFDIDADADIVNKKIRLWIDLNITHSATACIWAINHLRDGAGWRKKILDIAPSYEGLIDQYIRYLYQFTVPQTALTVRRSKDEFEHLMPALYEPDLLPGDVYIWTQEAKKAIHILSLIDANSRCPTPSQKAKYPEDEEPSPPKPE